MFDRKIPFSRFIYTFVGGVITGAVTALLLAPFSGKKMQQRVVEKVEVVQDALKRMAVA